MLNALTGADILAENKLFATLDTTTRIYEYNYRKNGMAVVLSNQDMTYYIYSNDKDFNATELQFIEERI